MTATEQTTETTQHVQTPIEVTAADLPLHCPTPDMSAWNSHPRVFLPIKAQGGRATCPYCGAQYQLKG